ncbi:MAG TPA: hypothetical protein VGY53_10835, partial [Isosphaeraceae bacterium]|nr:hypothetical protein [Isosphaeraceae bacterium]
DLRLGTHVNAIGSYNLGMREIDTEALKRARIVVDSRNACRAEAGELVAAWSCGEIAGPESWTELGEIVNGRAPGRQSAEEITLFKSVGNAAQDMAAARRAYLVAKDRGLGLEVDLD